MPVDAKTLKTTYQTLTKTKKTAPGQSTRALKTDFQSSDYENSSDFEGSPGQRYVNYKIKDEYEIPPPSQGSLDSFVDVEI